MSDIFSVCKKSTFVNVGINTITGSLGYTDLQKTAEQKLVEEHGSKCVS